MRLPFRIELDCFGQRPGKRRGQDGAVLLEVILALVLFVGAAAILSSGLTSSLDSMERLRLNTQAADLAVSVLSEVQMGIKTLELSGPQPFEMPQEAWSWEVVASPVQSEFEDATAFKRIEVIIRHDDPSVVYRLGQVVRLDGSTSGEAERLPGVGSF